MKELKEPTYCTVEDLEEVLDLPDPSDPMGYLHFSDMSHPSYNAVVKTILANEDQIDCRLRHSWRVNRVKEHVYNIELWEQDENARRSMYWQRGGNMVQLHQNILPFDPSLGDKIEIRTRNNKWIDISECGEDGEMMESPSEATMPYFRFDYVEGRLYLRTRVNNPRYNAVRVTYRWGDDGEVPDAIRRLCTLMTATNVLNQQMFNIKLGSGGDIAGIRDSVLRAWQEEMNMIWGSYQRVGVVRGLF